MNVQPMSQAPVPSAARPAKSADSARPDRSVLGKALHWVDSYTSPRPTTAGNFAEASYVQALLQGAVEGAYLQGWSGGLIGGGSALLGTLVDQKTRNPWLALASGAVAGAAFGSAVAAATGAPLAGAIVVGSLTGAFQTVRSTALSRVRDAGGNATMVSAMFVPGPAKVAGGIGAAIGARMNSRPAQALVGAASGAALGAALAATGFAPVSIPAAAAGSALAGAVGPYLGPRFSQFFRNLAEDAGKGLSKLLQVTGIRKQPLDDMTGNAVGSAPSSFIKEGLRGFMYSDGSLIGFLIGGVMESVQQAHIMFFSKREDENAGK
ncbi:MAG: hypothetical protein HY319_27495 [Armatimonadetes bacterium]|nr:hypothetical protein [Armatimonadota bacterium]